MQIIGTLQFSTQVHTLVDERLTLVQELDKKTTVASLACNSLLISAVCDVNPEQKQYLGK